MPFANLGTFLSFLESKGDLHRIKTEVDPVLEITEIATRVVREKGPALLFENVKGSRFPLVIGTLAAERRVEWALGRTPEQVGEELSALMHSAMPPSPAKLWERRGSLPRILAMKPSATSRAAVRANCISPADMSQLPLAQSWPHDGGKFITFPLVITKSPDDGKANMGVYRMHVYDKSTTGMHWQIAKGGGYHYQQAEAKNQPLRVAVTVGADPILMMCGILPLPEGLSEVSFAGFLRGKSTAITEMSDAKLPVPAEAEFVLDGYVPPRERRMEGPYGDHFGHYSLAAEFPIFHIERIWHRNNPVFPISVVGKPPQEDQVIGDAVQKMLLPLLKVMHPEVRDLWAYQEAGFHNLLVAAVHQRFEKEAVKTGLWALGEGQLALTKCVVLVDPDVNARSFNDVLRAIRENFDPREDFLLLPGTSQDTLDFTSYKMNLGSKMILDATTSPKKRRTATTSFNVDLDAVKKVDPRIQNAIVVDDTMLVIQVAGAVTSSSHVSTVEAAEKEGLSAGTTAGRAVLEKMISFRPSVPLVVAVSSDVPLNDPTLLLWGIFTRFDCARDTFFSNVRMNGGHPSYEGPMFIDATWKQGYPDGLTMNDDIVRLVDKRWKEYGFR